MKSPPKRRREIAVGKDVVVFDPVFQTKGTWKGSQYPLYRILLNGEDVAWVEYQRGVHQGHRVVTNGVGWTRLHKSKSWPTQTDVWKIAVFNLDAFADVAARVPAWAASGRIMTKAQQAVAVREWQDRHDKEDAEREAAYAASRAERQRRDEEAAQERSDMIDGLRSIRERLGADLTNFETAALEWAIKR